MNPQIEIYTPNDWEKIREAGLKVVVDPMVFRSADVFLRGNSGVLNSPQPTEPELMWKAITSNIGSLCTFFDTLILEEQMPMYDYNTTFPEDMMTGKRTLLEVCNDSEGILVPVSVHDEAYNEMKKQAVAILDDLPEVSVNLAGEIKEELSAFDYEWRPDLWRDAKDNQTEDEYTLDAFRYGGLLFSAYARRTGSDHVLQPKRSELYLATSMGAENMQDEKKLFETLTDFANENKEEFGTIGDLPATPTFLPLLLMKDPKSPVDLFKRAMKLRKSSIVKEYRQWRKEILEDIDKGRDLSKYKKELDIIIHALGREQKVDLEDDVTFNAKIGAKVASLKPDAEIGLSYEKKFSLKATYHDLLRNIPGYRYRKLLLRMTADQKGYRRLDKHLRKIWATS